MGRGDHGGRRRAEWWIFSFKGGSDQGTVSLDALSVIQLISVE